jgi:hypothetical protein
MPNRKTFPAATALLALAALAGCDREPTGAVVDPGETAFAAVDSTFSSNTNRRFTQVERLGNPLVMEVFVEKREHDAYDSFEPARDPFHFTDDFVAFITTVAKRDEAYARTIAGALLGTPAAPGDMIKVNTGRAAGVTAANMGTAATVGWLTNVLDPANGYGGRKLAGDDTVDKGTAAVFGNVLGNNVNVSPGLVGDNVNENDKAALTTFPYLPAPTQ